MRLRASSFPHTAQGSVRPPHIDSCSARACAATCRLQYTHATLRLGHSVAACSAQCRGATGAPQPIAQGQGSCSRLMCLATAASPPAHSTPQMLQCACAARAFFWQTTPHRSQRQLLRAYMQEEKEEEG